MRWACTAGKMAIVWAMAVAAVPVVARGQALKREKGPAPLQKSAGTAKGDARLQAIDDEYNRQLLELDKRRLRELSALASRQSPAEAAITYDRLFHLAIEANLFHDAEAAATKVIEQGTPSPATNGLAHLVKIIAPVDRGAYDESLKSARQALAESAQERKATADRAVIAPSEVIQIYEAYYERLIDAGQYATAREAFGLALAHPFRPAVKEFLASRLKRIELVGKPAPPIHATDIDGKPFDLAARKGKAVLLVFWATWCQPNAAQVSWLEEVEQAYRDRGLEVVGINVDVSQEAGTKLETVLPNIRRFLLDYNVPWPTLVNGTGGNDFASAYGVSDIPANVVVGKDGKVAALDLSRANLSAVIARVLGH